MNLPQVEFRGVKCRVEFAQYWDGGMALLLVDLSSGEEFARATVNVPGAALAEGQVLIKDYSENHGILDALEKAGILRSTGQIVESGYAQIPVCDLLVSPPGKANSLHAARSRDRER
jgi:hypothetical protein